MFVGRRRRTPFLGAAIIAGTATAAARHGARKQSRVEADRQLQMEQDAELRRYAQERERLENQHAIDQAVNDALAKQQATQPQAGPPPPTYAEGDPLSSPNAPSRSPCRSAVKNPAVAAPVSATASATDSSICFCSECGYKCGVEDNFCSKCGRSLER